MKRIISRIFGNGVESTTIHQSRPRLAVEMLEDRLALSTYTAAINGTDAADYIEVNAIGSNSVRVTVSDAAGNEVQSTFVSRVQKWGISTAPLRVNGRDGNDFIQNNTDWNVEFLGGRGDDTLVGGNGNDLLRGGRDDDVLVGKDGNDTLKGGLGMDSLFGGIDAFDADYLFGGADADRFLRMTPNSPDDLEMMDFDSATDAHIKFRNGEDYSDVTAGAWSAEEVMIVDEALQQLVVRTGNNVLLRTAYQFRDPADLQQLASLGVSTQLTFTRHSAKSSGAAGDADSLTGEIRIYDAAFSQTDDNADGVVDDTDLGIIGATEATSARQTVIHEIGHMWDEDHENGSIYSVSYDKHGTAVIADGIIDEFQALSGWVSNPTNTTGLTQGWNIHSWQTDADGNFVFDANDNPIPIQDTSVSVRGNDTWWFDSSKETEFARVYGHANPLEDFATSFAAVFMGTQYTGFNWDTDNSDGTTGQVAGGEDAIPAKAELINGWLDEIAGL